MLGCRVSVSYCKTRMDFRPVTEKSAERGIRIQLPTNYLNTNNFHSRKAQNRGTQSAAEKRQRIQRWIRIGFASLSTVHGASASLKFRRSRARHHTLGPRTSGKCEAECAMLWAFRLRPFANTARSIRVKACLPGCSRPLRATF